MSEPDGSEKRKTYLEERKLLIEAERESARSFDRTILTLSSGALALSITFIRQIAPAPRFENYLSVAWGGLIFALLCTLLSYLFSQSALRRHRDILDEDHEGKRPAREQRNASATITNCLNWAAILSFIVGVTFLTVFAVKNLPYRGETMATNSSKSTQPASEVEKKGFVPPKPPVEQPADKPPPPPDASKPEKK